jgi:tRNA uracil 4-sulfurtransferase
MIYILRYAEIALKGKNRIDFEKQLANNIKEYVKLRYEKEAKIKFIRGRLILFVDKEIDLRPVFGLSSYSKAIKIEKDISIIKDKALELFEELKDVSSFRIKTSRLDKSFNLKSPEINAIVGEIIYEKFNIPVDFKEPKAIIGIEIHNDFAYIYSKTINCFNGLPIGSSGEVFINENYDKRTILSVLELMKRGCSICFINNENKKDSSNLIKLFNNFKELEIIKESEIKNKFKAFAFPNYFDNLQKKQDFLNLYPIALLSDKEVEEELKKYERVL